MTFSKALLLTSYIEFSMRRFASVLPYRTQPFILAAPGAVDFLEDAYRVSVSGSYEHRIGSACLLLASAPHVLAAATPDAVFIDVIFELAEPEFLVFLHHSIYVVILFSILFAFFYDCPPASGGHFFTNSFPAAGNNRTFFLLVFGSDLEVVCFVVLQFLDGFFKGAFSKFIDRSLIFFHRITELISNNIFFLGPANDIVRE